jgi:hypothetical protein
MTFVLCVVLVAVVLIASCMQYFLDGRFWLWSYSEKLRLSMHSLSRWDYLRESAHNRSDIVISLTTIPERLNLLGPTLKSLLAQCRLPARILLWLPETSKRSGQAYSLPSWLQRLASVEICRCDKDMGPATKFLYALRAFPSNSRILVVDDDKIYPRSFVAQIEAQSNLYPDYALGYSGWRIPHDLTDRPTTLWMNIRRKPPAPVKSPWVRKLYPVDILQGYSGYLVKPGFFDLDALWNYEGAPEAAFFVDDVWISAHCNARKFVFKAARFCMEPGKGRRSFAQTALGKINSGSGDIAQRNNSQMIRYFSACWRND